MPRYVLKFGKTGYFKYTSHLDLLRFFKRSFKRLNIRLKYSQGFNPHPQLGFAQPLSLGYSSKYEILEFETLEEYDSMVMEQTLRDVMPIGLDILKCDKYTLEGKSLAALTVEAEYMIWIPINEEFKKLLAEKAAKEWKQEFMNLPSIKAMKRQKKTKQLAEVEIKDKIRNMQVEVKAGVFEIYSRLDAGSDSNLSPELLIAAFLEFLGLDIKRYDIEVERIGIKFSNGFEM